MKFDSIALASVAFEIKKDIIPAKIIEVYQLSKYEILFILKCKKGTRRLFFSIRPDRMAFFISNSITPSENFSSLFFHQLQNWIQGADLLDIEHYQFDRIIKLVIQPYAKFGAPKNYQLIIEFMGKHSNAILVDENFNIKSTLKQVGSDVNRFREIKPEIPYVYPPKQDKYNPLNISHEIFFNLLKKNNKANTEYLWQFLQQNFNGLSTKSAKEIVMAMGLPLQKKISKISDKDYSFLWNLFCKTMNKIRENKISPVVFIDRDSNNIIDYSLLPPITPNNNFLSINFKKTSNCLEFVFNRLSEEDKKKELIQNINKILNKNIKKFNKMKNIFQKKKKEIENSEEYRKKGELLKANLYRIKPGTKEITLSDFYNNAKEITVELDSNLSPAQNAEHYFNKYKKLQKNSKNVKEQTEEVSETVQQLEEIRKRTEENKDSLDKLTEIYYKLSMLGYIKKEKSNNIRRKKQQPAVSKFISPDGWTVIAGKNSKQNEYILRHLSSGNDFWLHNLTNPGGHIIIKNHKNSENPPYRTLLFAARLAGYYSKTKDKEHAVIIHTQRKYVKKPKDAKPGKVIYSNEKTLPILVNHDEIKKEMHKMWTT